MMTKFVLLIMLAHPNGVFTVQATVYTGADLCQSQRDELLAAMEGEYDKGTYSVQCVDSTLVPRLGEKQT